MNGSRGKDRQEKSWQGGFHDIFQKTELKNKGNLSIGL